MRTQHAHTTRIDTTHSQAKHSRAHAHTHTHTHTHTQHLQTYMQYVYTLHMLLITQMDKKLQYMHQKL